MKKRIISMLTVFVMVFAMFPQIAGAAAITSEGLTMVVGKSCKYYNSKTVNDPVGENILMGTEVIVTETGGNLYGIKYEGRQYYITGSNLVYKYYTVKEQTALVYSEASKSSAVKTELQAGNQMYLLDVVTSGGTKYLYGTVADTDITGYILMSSVKESSEYKSISTGTSVYESASTSAKKTSVYPGDDVEVLMGNDTWSKVIYGGNVRYISTKWLDEKVQYVKVDSTTVYADPYLKGISGELRWNTPVTVYETFTFDGVEYVRCGAGNVTGFVRKSDIGDSRITKIINEGGKLYSKASTDAVAGNVYAGDEVELMMSITENYAKVRYQGQIRYVSPSRLADKVEYVTAESTAVYADSSLKKTVETIYWNTPVTVYETLTINDVEYVRISDGNVTGIVKKSDIGYNKVGVAPRNMPMRAFADNEADKIETISAFEKFTVLYETENWVKINYNGKIGYIYPGSYEFAEYLAQGNCYTSAKNMVTGSASGTINEMVLLVAESADGKYAYVKTAADKYYWVEKSSLSVNEEITVLYLATERRWLRNEPSNDADGFEIPYMSRLEVINYDSSEDAWYKVKYEGQLYYIWIESGDDSFTRTESTYEYEYKTDIQRQIIEKSVQIAKEWPTKYVTGGDKAEMDSDGYYMFDCSGFASYILNSVVQQYNPLYRVSANITTLYDTDEIYNIGYEGELKAEKIKVSDLQAGDILFFDLLTEAEEPGKYCDHCAIYLGNGEFVHASSSWEHTSVIIMPLKGNYLEKLIYAKRLTPAEVIPANKEMCAAAYVNLYKTPDSKGEIIKLLSPGEKVTVDFVSTGSWSYVTYNGVKGYISTDKIEYVEALTAPGGFKVTLNASEKPFLQWNSVPGAVKYNIYRSETGKENDYQCIYSPTSTSYTNSGALKGGKYYYKVTAVSADGTEGPASEVCSIRVSMLPANVYIWLDGGKPKLQWYRVNGAEKYEIYRSTTGKSGSFTKVATVKATKAENMTYKNTGAPAGKTCYYKVRPISPEGMVGKYSNTVSIVTKTAAPVITVKLNAKGKPVVSWKKVTGAVKYEIYRSATGKSGSFAQCGTTTKTTFTKGNETSGKKYYYRVRAVNVNGIKSDYSKTVSKTAKPAAVKLKVVLTKGKPKLTWNSVTGAKKYEVYRAASKNGKYTRLDVVSVRNYTDKTAKKNKTYYYKVRAVTADKTMGAYNNPVKIKATK